MKWYIACVLGGSQVLSFVLPVVLAWDFSFTGMKLIILAFTVFSIVHSAQLYSWPGAGLLLAIIATFAFSAEFIALQTGIIPFVHAPEPLGPIIPGTEVPLFIVLAWYITVYQGLQAGNVITTGRLEGVVGEPQQGRRGLVLSGLVCASTITIFDLTTDPSLLRRGYWRYQGGGFYYGVPLVNFAGWFVLGFAVAVAGLSALSWLIPRLESFTLRKSQSMPLQLFEISAFIASAWTFVVLSDPIPLGLNLALSSFSILLAMIARMPTESSYTTTGPVISKDKRH